MKAVTANWFEIKVQYEQVQEDGREKKVTEQYVVDALSFTEAEVRITEEMSAYISGEFTIKNIKPTAYKEILFMNGVEKSFHNEVEELTHALQKGDDKKAKEVYDRLLEEQNYTDTRWYKAKLQFITIDEKSGKEKRQSVVYLVEATSLHNALDNIDTVMRGTMIDYIQANVAETNILDVFLYANHQAAELMARMAEELHDETNTVEEIGDKYVKTATPELRQQLIDKLTAIREQGRTKE